MPTCSPPATTSTNTITLIQLPDEVQVHILTFLRSFDLGPVQQTCQFYNNPDRIHKVVTHFVHHVYGTEYTDGVVREFDASSANNSNSAKKAGGKKHNKKNTNRKQHPKSAATKNDDAKEAKTLRYTLGQLRSIELAVVARVLSLPEPKTGYFVSKAWIKKTLLWLEKANEPITQPKKKLTKKQQRQRNRRLSDVSPPWPNANSDIICEHQNLQRSGAKAARSHRKLMDKKSWKVLSKLYPDSTQLTSVSGECLQCLMEAETARRAEEDRLEQLKQERKLPLANPHVRRFYTRTRGVPYHCLVENNGENEFGDDGGDKMSSPCLQRDSSSRFAAERCPLSSGTYVMLPRAWCHQWRRYIKTGEGCKPLPPDSCALLCDAHKLALLPPHVEAFLLGDTPQLYSSVKDEKQQYGVSSPSPVMASIAAASVAIPPSPVGVQPILDAETINALVAAGISRAEAATQRMAMMRLEEERHQQQQEQERVISLDDLNNNNSSSTPRRSRECNNELLDRENHVVTELVTHEEWLALQETGSWRKQISAYTMCVTVDNDGSFAFSTMPCRECDPTGLRFGSSCASMKNIHVKNSSKNPNRWRK